MNLRIHLELTFDARLKKNLKILWVKTFYLISLQLTGMKLFLLKIVTIMNHLIILFNKIDSLVNTYIPLRRLTKNEIKSKFKPRITVRIRNSMKRRNKFYKILIDDKLYEHLRNRIVQLCRESKKTYFQNYFSNNVNNIKNT